ncbi:MAG: hypothetical protein ACP5GB_02910 [Candidatus Micrarchaeia archaeon]
MPEESFSYNTPQRKLYEEVFGVLRQDDDIKVDFQIKVPTEKEIEDAVIKFLKEAGINVFNSRDYKNGVIISIRGSYGTLLELPEMLAKKFNGKDIGNVQIKIEGPGDENELLEYPSNVKVNGTLRINFKSPREY